MMNRLVILKKILGMASVILITSCGTGGNTSSSGDDINTGLIAFFPFNGNSNDESGNGKNGTVSGAVLTADKNGNPDSAYMFTGQGDFISAPVNINPEVLPQMTMVAWVRADSTASPLMKAVSHDDGGFDRTMGIDNRGGGVGWSAFTGTGEVLGFKPVVAGAWVFLAAVYDQNAGSVKFFVNDLKFEESGKLGVGLTNIHIGSNPSFGEFFKGAIDEVRIYNRALSDSEIQTLFTMNTGL